MCSLIVEMVLPEAASTALAQLAPRFGLQPPQLDRLATFAETLSWDPLAPTTVRDPLAVVNDHIADALVALELSEVAAARSLIDIGSGAGVPGIPLAIARPDLKVDLLESNGRKAEFLRRTCGFLDLGNVAVVAQRAEEWAGASTYDVVTARAVAALEVLAEYAAPLLKRGGSLVAWRGNRDPEVEAQGRIAAEILGLCVQDPVHVLPYPAAEHRYLHVMSKVMETPARFPRRPGMARKRPLGSSRARA